MIVNDRSIVRMILVIYSGAQGLVLLLIIEFHNYN